MELGSFNFLFSKQYDPYICYLIISTAKECTVYCVYIVNHNMLHQTLSMPELINFGYLKHTFHMNDLESMQNVILGVFLVTEMHFSDLYYISCFKVL